MSLLRPSVLLETVILKVVVEDTNRYHLQSIVEGKPDYILWISKSNDPAQEKTCFIVACLEGYNVEEIADWIECNEIIKRTPGCL